MQLRWALVAVALALSFWRFRRTPKQPHIVFILADDLGWNDVSYHGCPQIRTPNIDALAWNGVRLSRYYTQALCTPSRAALLTGMYPIHTGMQHSVLFQEEPRGLPLNLKLLPQWLGDLGYDAHIIGKWHLGFYKKEYTPTMRGFRTHVGSWGCFVDYYSHEKTMSGPATHPSGLDFRRDFRASHFDSGKYLTHLLTDEATKLIMNHPDEKPLFLYLAHQAPHSGNFVRLEVPETYTEQYRDIGSKNRTLYAGMVSALDESVGAVFEALDKRGMLSNSIVVFSSDNGGAPDEETYNSGSPWPLRGQKMSLSEGGVRAPALLWSPLLSAAEGSIFDGLFHITDWLPTFYELAGGSPSSLGAIDGVSQLGALTRQTTAPRKEVLINIDPEENCSAIIEGNFKLVLGVAEQGLYENWYPLLGHVDWESDKPRQECEKSVVARVLEHHGVRPVCGSRTGAYATPVQCGARDPSRECVPTKSLCLFNLSKDPCEYNNVADQHPEVVERLLAKLATYNASSIPPANVPLDMRSNPALHDNVWVSWGDLYL
ncbi:LOW QUALITY PROTEIN: arylsulfatase B [Ixodes scapularis]|uniref:LOW QUALITY PROTEIN: arylsulfatase B n=1 Tax=Ixodes scapularis TaxID=6945 RepID=UPI001C388570|nr:LOW QUALITY PROTEIN: arylsulfatase B [Ixodes scapularis]